MYDRTLAASPGIPKMPTTIGFLLVLGVDRVCCYQSISELDLLIVAGPQAIFDENRSFAKSTGKRNRIYVMGDGVDCEISHLRVLRAS